MPSQSLLQLRAVILHPAPNCGVVDVETTLLQQLVNIAQRQRIAKIPPDRTKDDAGFGLPPFEGCRSDGGTPSGVSRRKCAEPLLQVQRSCDNRPAVVGSCMCHAMDL